MLRLHREILFFSKARVVDCLSVAHSGQKHRGIRRLLLKAPPGRILDITALRSTPQLIILSNMPSIKVTQLLRLQEAELNLLAIDKDLKRFPLERGREEEAIAAENARAEEARGKVQALERKRSELAQEQGVEDGKLVRLKSQQAQVKKNEEYRALSDEIEHSETKVAQLEEEQLEVLFSIDAEKERCAEVMRSAESGIAIHRKKIAAIEERIADTKAKRAAAETQLSAERDSVAGAMIKLYDEARQRVSAPWVVPLKEQTCTGCHLRVSNEVHAQAGKELPAICDQCGRLVYID